MTEKLITGAIFVAKAIVILALLNVAIADREIGNRVVAAIALLGWAVLHQLQNIRERLEFNNLKAQERHDRLVQMRYPQSEE